MSNRKKVFLLVLGCFLSFMICISVYFGYIFGINIEIFMFLHLMFFCGVSFLIYLLFKYLYKIIFAKQFMHIRENQLEIKKLINKE